MSSRFTGREATLLSHDITQLVLTAADRPPDPGGDVPWWVYPIGLPILGVLIAIIRKAFKLDSTPVDPDSARRETVPNTPPATVEGKLDAAKELVLELRRDRDETKSELKEIATRHARELDELRRRHDRELGEMQAKLRSQDIYIERLEMRLGFGPPGPTDPFPRQQL